MPTTKTKSTKKKQIPHGWREIKLGKIGDFSKGKGISKNEITDQGYFAIRYAEIYTKYDFKAENITSFISEESAQNSKLIQQGDLIFAGSGESAEDIGKSVVYLKNEKCFVGGDTIIFTPKDQNSDSLFLSYQLNTPKVRIEISKKSTGQSVVHVYKKDLEGLTLLLPPPQTQNKIVEILETWDSAINKLGRKIEIKKEIKRGLMQQLLNYKLLIVNDKLGVNPNPTKSPKDWKDFELGEVCENITTGKLDANAMKENGQFRFYTCAKDYYFIDEYAFDTEALLISGNGANVGYIHYYKGKFNAYQRTYVLSNFRENIMFIKFLLDLYLKKRIFEEKQDGNTPYIKMGTLTDMNLLLPPLPEQKAIAEVLSTADSEIEVLEQKLQLYKDQKKYLLNKLMTGEIIVNG